MDKHKLLRIIGKDLEELRFLSEEITENEGDSSLVIDLALSKAKLLCQEIEVLKEISTPVKQQTEKAEEQPGQDQEESIQEEEYETIGVADPELEILNFEHENQDEEKEIQTPEENEWNAEDEVTWETEPQEEEEEEAEETQAEYKEAEEPQQETEPQEEDEEEKFEEEEDLEEDSDEDFEEEITEEEEFEETILEDDSEGSQPEFREIALDDDDEIETIQIPTSPTFTERPVMHEIPKPDEVQGSGKTIVGEAFQKERSINDALGENKSGESKLSNGPISSLRAAIGLNDRFLFIREIFGNNAEKYNLVIDNLDKLETIQQAVEYLKANLSLEKNETSLKFVDLLKRRFTK